jgi:putative addiction module killer protein
MENKFEVEAHERYVRWWEKLRDKRAKVRINVRVERIQVDGNLGNHKFLRDGVWELKIDYGPGYRVYYTWVGGQMILLLGGGDKSTQEHDIERAILLAKEIKIEKEK